VTIGKYYRITGDSVQNRGVMPEIVLPSLISTDEVGESTKDSALPWDRIKPAEFATNPALAEWILPLNHAHEQRLATNPDLKELADDATAFAQIRGQKTVSLRLATRSREREAQDMDRLGRINARRAAHGQPPLASLEELKPDEEPDANLAEAAEIVVDLRDALTRPTPKATTARR
jgi:carboxyl-terminal processing protease